MGERLTKLKAELRPTLVLGGLADISAQNFLDQLPSRIRGIAWDFNRTLIGNGARKMPPRHVTLLKGIANLGVAQVILSNAASERKTERVLGVVRKELGSDMHVVTSLMVDGHEKPDPELFNRGAEIMGIHSSEAAGVGDQLFRDTLGANRAGYGATVLVPPFGGSDDLLTRYWRRPFEVAIGRPLAGVPILASNFAAYHEAQLAAMQAQVEV